MIKDNGLKCLFHFEFQTIRMSGDEIQELLLRAEHARDGIAVIVSLAIGGDMDVRDRAEIDRAFLGKIRFIVNNGALDFRRIGRLDIEHRKRPRRTDVVHLHRFTGRIHILDVVMETRGHRSGSSGLRERILHLVLDGDFGFGASASASSTFPIFVVTVT